jgi:DNA-binding NarL/FixJ family response regulator
LLREALKCAITRTSTIEVVGEACHFNDLSKHKRAPDVISLSRGFPPEGGVSSIPEIKKIWPTTKILILTDPDDLSICRSAHLAGCHGMVLLDCNLAEFATAVQSLHQGKNYIPTRLQEMMERPIKPRKADRTPMQSLSNRERQVLICLSRGMSYKQIAEKLFLGVKSIETYRARLFSKLNFDSKADLMRFAIDNGLMNPALEV